MWQTMRSVVAVFTAVWVVGCVSTSAVLEIGKDTYSVSATADGMRTAASARESAYGAGNSWCKKDGKHFSFINESTAPTRMGIDTTVTVMFRCLRESDPEYTRPNIQ
jgi:hypothetical protein